MEDTTEYRVAPDVFVTPLAREYLRDRGIGLVIMDSEPVVMTRTPLSNHGQRYIDAGTGAGYSEKPEHIDPFEGKPSRAKDPSENRIPGDAGQPSGGDYLSSGGSL